MKRVLLLFDVDNTLAHSGARLSSDIVKELKRLALTNKYELGVVGGGTNEKIMEQLSEVSDVFVHILSESGCVYHKNGILQYTKDLRSHSSRADVDKVIKRALLFLATVPYHLSGHVIDFRKGLVYISCIGMNATNDERKEFMKKYPQYRENLLHILKSMNLSSLSVKKGGSVGLAVFPKEWSKVQVMEVFKQDAYDKMLFFGDSVGEDGNDEELLQHPWVDGIVVRNPEDTLFLVSELM